MAFSVNHVVLVGNISSDPELTYTPKGTALLKFSLATNYSRKTDSGEWEDIPSFHRITVWGKMAEFLGNNTSKGDKLYVDGRIEYGSYEKDGIKRYTTDIIANNVIPMNNRGGGAQAGSHGSSNSTYSTPKPVSAPAADSTPAASTPSSAGNSEPVSAEDIPF